ncbi:MAG: putative motility protein, partial [Proteobacteria bacterium]|nr:putative motility protein [Pseudomonadota bacterium]
SANAAALLEALPPVNAAALPAHLGQNINTTA